MRMGESDTFHRVPKFQIPGSRVVSIFARRQFVGAVACTEIDRRGCCAHPVVHGRFVRVDVRSGACHELWMLRPISPQADSVVQEGYH